MRHIPEHSIDEIRERVDVVDLISRYITLRQVGRSFKGLCPFHEEKTPSFHVNRERQIFHCFGCGAGGNVFTFLMKRDGLTFVEAVRQLASECGVEIPDAAGEHQDTTRSLFDANEIAQRTYRRALAGSEGAAARAYLARRGLDAALTDRFGIGFAPDRWDAVSRALGEAAIDPAVGERAGLLAKRDSGGFYDRLRARVTFPIHDVRGRVIGFGGRATKSDQEPKYLNTPETAVFRKRETLYGLPGAIEPARRTDRLVVVEGYFDRIALARAGIAESVATCGTALSREHATQLRRRARQTVLLFDGDGAGQRAIVAALETLLPEGLRVLAAVLPEGDDPDTFLEREGPEALAALVEGARPALSIVLERAVARGIATPFARADAAAMVAPLLARVVDGVERADWVRRVALAVGVDERHVALSVRAAMDGDDRESAKAAASAALASVSATLTPIDRALRSLVRLLLAHPALASRVCADAWHEALSENIHMKLVIAILDQVELGGEVTPGALVDRLDGDTRALLLALAVDDAPHLEPLDAERVLDETLARLEMRRMRHEHRATTEQLRDVAAQDSSSLLREKQRQIERKRAVLGIGTATPVAP